MMYSLEVFKMSTTSKVTREVFVSKTQTNLHEIRESMDALREKSSRVELTEDELKSAFDNLYDAKDYLVYYAKHIINGTSTKAASSSEEELYRNGASWVKSYMHDLVEYGVGTTAEIRRFRNEHLKSATGADVGAGDEINVRFLNGDLRSSNVILKNWLEVDSWFWEKDHQREYDEYQYHSEYDHDGWYSPSQRTHSASSVQTPPAYEQTQ